MNAVTHWWSKGFCRADAPDASALKGKKIISHSAGPSISSSLHRDLLYALERLNQIKP